MRRPETRQERDARRARELAEVLFDPAEYRIAPMFAEGLAPRDGDEPEEEEDP